MSAAPSTPTYGALTNQGASTNIAWHHTTVDRAARAEQQGHRSAILWFTGLSGSGKSTLANAVNSALFNRGLSCYVLDGDNIRHGLCKDLGFSDAAREENIRRIGEVSKLFLDAGVVVLTAFVSPFKADRDEARAGEIKEFTGISSPYEAPENPELRVHTGSQNLEESVATVVAYLEAQGIITAPAN